MATSKAEFALHDAQAILRNLIEVHDCRAVVHLQSANWTYVDRHWLTTLFENKDNKISLSIDTRFKVIGGEWHWRNYVYLIYSHRTCVTSFSSLSLKNNDFGRIAKLPIIQIHLDLNFKSSLSMEYKDSKKEMDFDSPVLIRLKLVSQGQWRLLESSNVKQTRWTPDVKAST